MGTPVAHTAMRTWTVSKIALLTLALSGQVHAKAAYKDHIYVTAGGPSIAGQSQSPHIYIYELRFDDNHRVQSLKLMDSFDPPGTIRAFSSWGYVYLGTSSELIRYAITSKGLLVDPVSIPIQYPSAMVIDDYYHYAYLIQDSDDGPQNLVVLKLTPLTGDLEVVNSVPMLNDTENLEYFFDLTLTGKMVYATSSISVGQFVIGEDRETLTRQNPVIIPGTNVMTTGCDQFRGPFVVTLPDAYGLHQVGSPTGPCQNYHSELLGFLVDTKTGLLSLGAGHPVPSIKELSRPGALVRAVGLTDDFKSYLYTSDTEFSFNTSPCDEIASVTTETGAQRIAAFDGASGDHIASYPITNWTGPTVVSCPHTENCLGVAQDGKRAPISIPLAVSTRQRVLAVGDPGLIVHTVSAPGLPCFPTPTEVARSPKLRLFDINPETGTLSSVLAKSIPNDQMPITIYFRRVDRLLAPIDFDFPALKILRLNDLLDFDTKYGPSQEITFKLPPPKAEDVEIVVGGFYKVKIKHQDFTTQIVNQKAVYTFSGKVKGVQVDVTIKELDKKRFGLKLTASPIENLDGLVNPVLVGLSIGELTGTVNVTADIQ